MGTLKRSFEIPYKNAVIEKTNLFSQSWEWFFKEIYSRLYSLGSEDIFEIANNQSTPSNIDGLQFTKTGVSQATVDFLIQRVTTSTGATELIETGIFVVSYNPTSNDWSLTMIGTPGPDDSGVDFSIDATGQVKYASSSITGTASISRVIWRARTLSAKHSTYSLVGTR